MTLVRFWPDGDTWKYQAAGPMDDDLIRLVLSTLMFIVRLP